MSCRYDLKIAMVTAFWGPAYPTGSGIYACELADRLVREDHQVDVFTSRIGNTANNGYSDQINVNFLPTHGMLWDMNPLTSVFKILVKNHYDIVHVHSYIFFLSNTVALARGMKDFNYVLQFHGGLDHHHLPDDNAKKIRFKDTVFDNTLGKFTVQRADRLLSVSKTDIPIIKEKFGKDADYLPNAVSTDMFRINSNVERRYVTYIGKFEPWKGFGLLPEIFQKVYKKNQNIRFRVVGDGSMASGMDWGGLPVEVINHVCHNQIPKILDESMVTVLPSYMEGTPTVCLESLAGGVPVVATSVGDTEEVVKHNSSGFVCAPGNVNEIAEAVSTIINDPHLWHSMSDAGKEYIEKHFSYEVVMQRVLEIYGKMM